MKVILPLAGKGTRLLPLTRHVPKPLVRVAGRPVMDYVMDEVDKLDVEELLIVTGHLKEDVEAYVASHYGRPARFVEQKVQDGTAGAVNLARPWVDGPVLIIFVDTLFDADLTLVNRMDADGIIWAKEVEDYQRYGVVVTDDDGYMQRIVEKPSEPISRLANIGLYYVRDWECLFDGIERTLAGEKHKGEWFLTDAFQYMIDQGRRIKTAEVGGWYDCGKVETLLETNDHLLRHGRGLVPDLDPSVTVVEPVRIAESATVRNSTVGPNVTIDEGATVEGSNLRESIVGERAIVRNASLHRSLVGPDTVVEGVEYDNMVAATDEAAPAR
ncbi:MAG: sugar phosphate nucleotidyltransferase [Acidimicrobiia bacterium]|nr:sugar phosphate nucleotidyltransferase [Acidimicrobiia bacterium]